MNSWKNNTNIGSQADTYIERHFEEACRLLTNGDKILNEWRERKNNYVAYTSTTIFDFQHYSRHDATHSVNILESIELMLGKERIDKLSAGDLWLILETAYFHDIGMSLSYDDLLELWEEESFQEYLRSGLAQDAADCRDAKNWYLQMDNLVHNRRKMEGIEKETEIEFEDVWPVELERRLLFLVADYIRRDHHKRGLRFVGRFDGSKETYIPKRMYLLVAYVSLAHGESFKYVINELEEEAKGFGVDRIHPRFVAALLRLGDLLDMDNNRFNMRAVEHYGKLPWSSEVHLRKHKAITHILISPHKISAEACSDNLDVCMVTNNWLEYIREEVKNFVCYWNEMSPEELGGCVMQMAECKVYHPHKPIVFNAHYQRKFEVDKGKLTDLLIGTNIYDINMDFLREYIQNSLDATKMRIWLELKEGKYREQKNPAIERIEELSPLDIDQKIYEDCAIEIRVSMDYHRQKVLLEIIDQGIGMESGCINAISMIGAGWRERKEYNKEIPKMPGWLKPTGGFGIGVQSAFMVTDKVELITKADTESEAHKIVLTTPRKDGTVTVESGLSNIQRGTIVKLQMDYRYFQEWNQRHDERGAGDEWEYASSKIRGDEKIALRKNNVQELIGAMPFIEKTGIHNKDIFDADNCLDYVIRYLECYLSKLVVNSIIPIKITNIDRPTKVLRSRYLPNVKYWDAVIENKLYDKKAIDPDLFGTKRYKEVKISDAGWSYRCIYDLEKNSMVLWNMNELVFTYIRQQREIGEHTTCFKNICVVRNTDFYLPYASKFDLCIDFMGHNAEAALKVHRNAYNEGLQERKYLKSSIRVYLKAMLTFWAETDRLDSVLETSPAIKYLRCQVKDNLFQYPLPIISSIYFPDVNILNQYTPEAGDAIRVSRIQIESVNDNDILLKNIQESIELKMILRNFQQFFNPKKERAIFLERQFETSSGRERLSFSKYKNNIIKDWLVRDKLESDDKRIKENHEIWEILEQLKEWNYCVVADPEIIRLFVESELFDEKLFAFSELQDEDTCFSMLTWKKEEKLSQLNENVFYSRAYNAMKIEERYIAAMPDADYHEILKVTHLPYNYDDVVKGKGPYLISPISNRIRSEILLHLRNGEDSIQDIRYEKFEKIVTEREEYMALLQWVYDHQVTERRYKLEEIDKEYRRFIEKIYHESTDL